MSTQDYISERHQLQAETKQPLSKVNPNNPPWPAYRGFQKYSFAHPTVYERLPKIFTNATQDIITTLSGEWDEERITDLTQCLARLENLLDDIKKVSKLRPIVDDNEADVPTYNKEIARYFRDQNFENSTWLFSEIYAYRRLHEAFSVSKYFKDYDVFFRQKCDTFSRSGDAVIELASRFGDPIEIPKDKDALKIMLLEITQICLWGNATDLSLLVNMTEEDIKTLQSTGGERLKETLKNILGNQLEDIWNYVSSPEFGKDHRAQGKGGRIDIVLDNAGFELFCDCLYADWLIQAGFASSIRFHGKRIPWFVSDVTQKDWDWLLNQMTYGHLFQSFSEEQQEALRHMGRRWKQYEKEGKFIYKQHAFWTTGYAYWHLKERAPDLFLDLSDSDLVVFKGDLNHRKLTYDCHAPPSTSFVEAIGPLATEPGAPPVVTLRTLKADVVVGVSQEKADQLDKEEPNWRVSGKYAVVLFSPGQKGKPVEIV